jgi:hypothetical protein
MLASLAKNNPTQHPVKIPPGMKSSLAQALRFVLLERNKNRHWQNNALEYTRQILYASLPC